MPKLNWNGIFQGVVTGIVTALMIRWLERKNLTP